MGSFALDRDGCDGPGSADHLRQLQVREMAEVEGQGSDESVAGAGGVNDAVDGIGGNQDGVGFGSRREDRASASHGDDD